MNSRIGLTFFGDSIMNFRKKECSWVYIIQKKINKKFKNNFIFYKKIVTGLNTRSALNIIPDHIQKIKYKNIIIIQLGANDSWHYKSFGGLAEVDLKSFKLNLLDIIKKLNYLGYKKIIFVTYHSFLNNRLEVNKKSINENLKKYIKEIKIFYKNKKIDIIEVDNKSKYISPRKMCLPLPDGIHLNNNGAKIYTDIIYKYLKKQIFYDKKI